jgi:hypothetical protein
VINREIKVGDRLVWKCRDPKRRREFVVKRIIGDSVWHKDGYFITCFSRPEDFEHVDEPPTDPVNHPPHYNAGDIECIDAIHAALGREGFIAYCQGNAIKYLWRHEHKGGVEDWRKADWYINRAIKELGK